MLHVVFRKHSKELAKELFKMDIQTLLFQTGRKFICIVILSIAVFAVVFCAEPYQDESVEQHNKYRRRYATPPLVGSEELNEAAVKCAIYYGEIGKINHKCPHKKVANFSGEAGENLYTYNGNGNYSRIGGGAGWTWWKEHKNYNHSNVRFSHFTQQIWKSTTHMGIGVHKNKGTWYACALYYPHGNVVGATKSNLMPRDESVTE